MDSVRQTVIEIDARNHAGVLGHIVGLFTRRACNIDGVVCLPRADGKTSRIWFLIGADEDVAQMVRHVANLHDVLAVCRRDNGAASFARLAEELD